MALTKSPRRVVVTGVGLVTACGHSTIDTWNALVAGRGGVGPITSFDASAFSTRFAAEVRNFEPLEFMDAKDSKRTDRTVHLAMAATRQALAGIDFDSLDRNHIGVVIGSGIGGIATFERQHSILRERGPDKVSPFFIPMMIADMPSGYVSIAFGLKGPNYATVSACASGGNAIADAYLLIKAGHADAVVTGVSDPMLRDVLVMTLAPDAELVMGKGEWLLFHSKHPIVPILSPDEPPPPDQESSSTPYDIAVTPSGTVMATS